MPIPFTDLDEGKDLGSAGFFKLERSSDYGCCLGALFVVGARGEPLEFGYNRVRVPQPYLWRPADLQRHTQRRLITSLLSVCSQRPRLLLCLANEVTSDLFSHDIRLEMPVARVSASPHLVDPRTGEVMDDEPAPPEVAWQPFPPDAGSTERKLFEHLAAHGLLLEPFDRAALGIREVYTPKGSHAAV